MGGVLILRNRIRNIISKRIVSRSFYFIGHIEPNLISRGLDHYKLHNL